jgi:hypothetical protein
LSTTKSHMTTRSRTPDRSGGKPVINRLSYSAASVWRTKCWSITLKVDKINVTHCPWQCSHEIKHSIIIWNSEFRILNCTKLNYM